jgi:hypothetical protein
MLFQNHGVLERFHLITTSRAERSDAQVLLHRTCAILVATGAQWETGSGSNLCPRVDELVLARHGDLS